MWSTIIATAVAATVGLSLVNVAFEMSRVRDARASILNTDRSIPQPGATGSEIVAPPTTGPGA